jgi:hypothetical protein
MRTFCRTFALRKSEAELIERHYLGGNLMRRATIADRLRQSTDEARWRRRGVPIQVSLPLPTC